MKLKTNIIDHVSFLFTKSKRKKPYMYISKTNNIYTKWSNNYVTVILSNKYLNREKCMIEKFFHLGKS